MFKAQIGYDASALDGIFSKEAVDLHYLKHHTGYANKLNNFIQGTSYENLSLEEIIVKSRSVDDKIFNNAAQLFNHDFYWKCLKLGETAPEDFKSIISHSFGSFEDFQSKYIDFADSHFGSGWSWLGWNGSKLEFKNTQNAETLIGTDLKPVCVIDLWEHAYYVDYKNDRRSFISTIVNKAINWSFCKEQIA